MNKRFISCTILVLSAGSWQLKAQSNLLMGAGNDNTHGSFNTSYGFLQRIEGDPPQFQPAYTSGGYNTFIGANSGNFNSGSGNTALGFGSAGFFLKGNNNVFIGYGASGTPNSLSISGGTYVGSTVSGNSFLGFQAGYNNKADYNVFLGYQSGYGNTTGTNNVFLGSKTGYANTAGGDNAFLGFQAGQNNSTGTDNTFVGSLAGQSNISGQFNSFVGSYTGQANTTGRLNTFMGYGTGSHNSAGRVNTFLGAFAGTGNTTGNQNSFVGYQAGQANTTGTNNTFVGYQAGQNVTTGSNNIIIGPTSGTAITDGSDNVLMGYNSQAEDGLYNAIAIGTGSRVAVSNALILGNQVNVGIGTSAPTARLHVRNGQADESGLRLEQLTSQSPATNTTDQFLTVNEKGDVIKARYQLRITSSTEWSDKVFSPAYSLRPLSSVASYIGQHGHLPGIPSAEEVVQKGMDLTKLNALLLEKIEELTLYSIQLEKVNQQQQENDKKQQAEIDELKGMVRQLLEKK